MNKRYEKGRKSKNTKKEKSIFNSISITLTVLQIFSIVYNIVYIIYPYVNRIMLNIMFFMLKFSLCVLMFLITLIFLCPILKLINIKANEDKEFCEKREALKNLKDNKEKRKMKRKMAGRLIKKNSLEFLLITSLVFGNIELFFYTFVYYSSSSISSFVSLIFFILYLGTGIIYSIYIAIILLSSICQRKKVYYFENNNVFCKIVNKVFNILMPDNYIPISSYVFLFSILILNISFFDTSNFLRNELKNIKIEEAIRKDMRLKLNMSIDKILEKADIIITDDEIEEKRKELKEKYEIN